MKHLFQFFHLSILLFFLYLIPYTALDIPHFTAIHAQAAAKSSTKGKAQVSGSQMDVTFSYGFDGCTKSNRQMVIRAEVKNNGKDFQGTIGIIKTGNTSGYNNRFLYETACVLASGETKTIEFSVPAPCENWPCLIIKDQKEKTVLQKTFRVTMTTESDILFAGVISDNQDGMNYISSTGSSKLFYFDETNLPTSAKGLDALDMLYITGFNTSRLKPEQISAILGWVENGGLLFLGTGPDASSVLSGFDGTIDYTIGDTKRKNTRLGLNKDSFHALKQELYTSADKDLDVDSSMNHQEQAEYTDDQAKIETNAPVNSFIAEIESMKLTPMKKDMVEISATNSSAILTEKKFPLILKNSYGNGVILTAAFDLAMEEPFKNSMGIQLYRIAKQNFSSAHKNRLEKESDEYNQYYEIARTINGDNISRFPNLGTYFMVLAIYAVLAGPLLYLILKKLDKRHLMWILMPTAGVLCTAIIYLIGSSTRITEPFIMYLSSILLDQADGENTSENHVYFSVTAPYNRKYSVPLNNVSNVDIFGQVYDAFSYSTQAPADAKSTRYMTGIYQNSDTEATLIMNDYSAFRPAYFQCVSKESGSITGQFDANLTLDKNYKFDGSFTNNLGIDLLQAVYTYNGNIYILGPLKNGESISLKDCEHGVFDNNYSSGYMDSGEETLSAIAGGDPWNGSDSKANSIHHAYSYHLGNGINDANKGAKLIALTSSNTIGFLEDTGLKTSGIQILDIRMDAPPYTGGKLYNLDNAFLRVEAGDGDFPSDRFLYFDEQIVAYQIPKPKKVKALSYNPLGNLELYDSPAHQYAGNYSVFDGTVEAKNVKTGSYEAIIHSGRATDIDDLSAYIDKEGIMTLRYVPAYSNGGTVAPRLYLLY